MGIEAKKSKENFERLMENYSKITAELNNYPLWKEKFQNDIMKLVSFSNIRVDYPDLYKIFQAKQILFK